jgi:Uncharacterised nucleotidyltransferase
VSRPVDQAASVQAAANNLRIDAATAEVLRAFEEAQVRSVLLKGPALSAFYPGDAARGYLDCDLWVPPSDIPTAEERLARLGFSRTVDERGLPDWWLEHASSWLRRTDTVDVDLHRTLQGIGVEPDVAWDTLSASNETVLVAGYAAPVLSLPARAAYVTLHAAHHGKEWGKALIHLEHALAAADDSVWRKAGALAAQLQAIDSFAAGLHLLPEGAALAERLGLPETSSVKATLRASSPPPIALGFEQLAGADTPADRIRILGRKLLPPPGFIRHWWPPAGRNRRMLALGYLYRPVWLLRNAPRGFRSWRQARRQVGARR